ncbi:MAG: DNA-binding protein [Actinomycetales bacterium]|nr:DNA-binding protein [Actinomycetales bacterium]
MENSLDDLVARWLTVPDLCEDLALDAGKVRRLIAEHWLVGARQGERNVFAVPAEFLVAREPAPGAEGPDAARWAVLASLRGTITLLLDAGLDEAEAIEWLFSPSEELGSTPLEALRAGHKAPVRRAAQTLF